jgi:hypothetical protein
MCAGAEEWLKAKDAPRFGKYFKVNARIFPFDNPDLWTRLVSVRGTSKKAAEL